VKRLPTAARTWHPYEDWAALIGGPVQVRRDGAVVSAGTVDDVMPDSSALWLAADAGQGRRCYTRSEGYEVWISPRDLQPTLLFRPSSA